ncbi:MAG TPA: hypothetical protein VFX21_02860, partial [Acidimicrobiia bacterium]|nr:hypothetical protein [Acidimicrobiia bacterium]
MGIVEVRVHGVSGTSPDQLLDDPHPRLITGDALSGFYRPRAGRQPDDRTDHEAYAWGGLTSGSPWRALWVLLAPFAMVNAAASMHRTRARVARPLTRLLALSLTATLVLSTYVLSADLFAWQCGSDTACIERHSYTRFLGWEWLDSPGRRLVVALLLPIAVVCLLWALGRATWQRAEAYVPEPTVMPRVVQTPFDHPQLWDGRARGIFLRHIHISGATATLAALLSYALRETTGSMGFELVVAVVLLVVIVALAIPEVPAHVDHRRQIASWVVLALSWLTLGRVLLFAWTEPTMHSPLPEQLPGTDRTVTYLFVAQLVAILALLAFSRWPAAAVSFVALSLGAAFGAGLVIGVGVLLGDLGTRELRLPLGVSWAARVAALLAAFVAFLVLVYAAVLTARRFGGRPPLPPLERARLAARRTDRVPVYTAVVMAVLVP